MLLVFFDDRALRRNEVFLSLIVFLYCFLSSSYFWCSFGFLLSRDFIRDSSSLWWSLTMVGFFMQGAKGRVNFTRRLGAWLSNVSVKSLFKVDDLSVLPTVRLFSALRWFTKIIDILIHIISTVFIVWFITFFFYVWDYERYVIFNFISIYDVIVYQFIWNIATNVTY